MRPVMTASAKNLEIKAKTKPEWDYILSPEALEFVAALNERFNQTRIELLSRRHERQFEINSGKLPGFLEETAGSARRSLESGRMSP